MRTEDDILTFQGGKYCQIINWIMVEKVSKKVSDDEDCIPVQGYAIRLEPSGRQQRVSSTTGSMEECVNLVKSSFPSANGVQQRDSDGDCHAQFGLYDASTNTNYHVCRFGKALRPPILSSMILSGCLRHPLLMESCGRWQCPMLLLWVSSPSTFQECAALQGMILDLEIGPVDQDGPLLVTGAKTCHLSTLGLYFIPPHHIVKAFQIASLCSPRRTFMI